MVEVGKQDCNYGAAGGYRMTVLESSGGAYEGMLVSNCKSC